MVWKDWGEEVKGEGREGGGGECGKGVWGVGSVWGVWGVWGVWSVCVSVWEESRRATDMCVYCRGGFMVLFGFILLLAIVIYFATKK